MHIGMRNFKTALAVALSIFVSNFFALRSPFFVAIAAIIAMQSSVADSFKTGKNRMLGTILGALVGLIFALWQPNNSLLCGLGIVIVIYFCNLLHWQQSIPIACIVFITIMVNLEDSSPWLYSWNRIVDTFIGITIAVLVNYFIPYYNHLEKIYQSFNRLAEQTTSLIKEKFCLGKTIDLAELNRSIINFQSQLAAYMAEFQIERIDPVELARLNRMLDIYSCIYEYLKISQTLAIECCLNEENSRELQKLFDCHMENTEYVAREENIVFNFLLKRIIVEIRALRALT